MITSTELSNKLLYKSTKTERTHNPHIMMKA